MRHALGVATYALLLALVAGGCGGKTSAESTRTIPDPACVVAAGTSYERGQAICAEPMSLPASIGGDPEAWPLRFRMAPLFAPSSHASAPSRSVADGPARIVPLRRATWASDRQAFASARLAKS